MGKLDQFESAFKSAAKAVYSYSPIAISKVLVVTDLDEEHTRHFTSDVRALLLALSDDRDDIDWQTHHADADESVGDLLEVIEQQRPDLICCYRNLHSRARHYPFSLGAHVDVLTQAIDTPVLLLPAPSHEGRLDDRLTQARSVMVLTDHLTDAAHLIDYGVRFAPQDGTLVLVHLEDDATFERYIGTIGKIPSIDTDHARERIRGQLLKEPADYIGSVRGVLQGALAQLSIEEEVRMGHHVSDCREVIKSHGIELLVMNTKDDEQLAMHGLAYPLAIELRDLPLLLL